MKVPIIQNRTWNTLVSKIGRRLPARVILSDVGFVHPWTVTLDWASSDPDEYDPKKGEWRMQIEPGFVNGVDPEIPTIANLANERTINRLKDAGIDASLTMPVTAQLAERPQVAIPATLPRVIGRGADATAVNVSDSGELRVETEPIPAFFAQLNVEGAIQLVGNLNTGIQEVATISPEDARRLRAFDVALYQDRPALKIDASQRGVAALDGFSVLLNYTYGRNSPANKRPYLKVLSKYVSPLAGAVSLLEGGTDPEFDAILVATIYFLSPAGADEGATLDGTWTPYVQHNLFWNLAHATQKLVPPADNKPLTISTGLAGGLGDMIGNQILAPNNEAYAEALLQLKARTAEGRFWSL